MSVWRVRWTNNPISTTIRFSCYSPNFALDSSKPLLLKDFLFSRCCYRDSSFRTRSTLWQKSNFRQGGYLLNLSSERGFNFKDFSDTTANFLKLTSTLFSSLKQSHFLHQPHDKTGPSAASAADEVGINLYLNFCYLKNVCFENVMSQFNGLLSI